MQAPVVAIFPISSSGLMRMTHHDYVAELISTARTPWRVRT